MTRMVLLLALAGGLLAGGIGRDSWFTDERAFTVGDLLTVIISEQASGSNSASVDTKREDGLELSVQGGGGPLTFLPEITGSSDSRNEHKVKGGNTRSNKMIGRITAEVIAIDPDGSLVIEGVRLLAVDGEEQITELSGRVRPEDVNADNTIQSYHVANAVIRFTGKGVVREAQRRSMFNWLFGWML
jgi:flagellar L-ring protein precursor FlgH